VEGAKQTVVVLGASPKPERYSNRAVKLLQEHGHHVIPVHPSIAEIDGLPVAASLADIERCVDTLTLYVSPAHSTPLIDAILSLSPKRVIFNPGTENPALKNALADQGIPAEEACTLILLNTGQF
jgi:predicted CoA-binding protein